MSVPYSSESCAWMSRTLMPRAYMPRILSSKPVNRRWYFFTSCGSNVPLRSRGIAIGTGPCSVWSVLVPLPLRELPLPRPSTACSSYPRWSVSSASSARSTSAPVSCLRSPPGPVRSSGALYPASNSSSSSRRIFLSFFIGIGVLLPRNGRPTRASSASYTEFLTGSATGLPADTLDRDPWRQICPPSCPKLDSLTTQSGSLVDTVLEGRAWVRMPRRRSAGCIPLTIHEDCNAVRVLGDAAGVWGGRSPFLCEPGHGGARLAAHAVARREVPPEVGAPRAAMGDSLVRAKLA